MTFQVKVEYGGKRFAPFLLKNVSYDGLVSSIRKNCSSLAHLDAHKIRLHYCDEGGDMVNVCQADLFAYSEILRTEKEKSSSEEEENIKRLASALERAKTSFFAVMRPRLKAQNLLQYGTGKLMQLDRDLLILQRALNNKVPDWPESQDWNFHLSLISFRTLN